MLTKFFWPACVAIICVQGIVQAWLSKSINSGLIAWWWSIAGAITSGIIWGLLASQPINVMKLSLIYDFLISTSYMAGLIFFGESMTRYQILGVVFMIIGVVFTSYK